MKDLINLVRSKHEDKRENRTEQGASLCLVLHFVLVLAAHKIA